MKKQMKYVGLGLRSVSLFLVCSVHLLLGCAVGPGPTTSSGPCTPETALEINEEVTSPATWQGCVFVSRELVIKAPVTVEAGTTVFVEQGVGLLVEEGGSLQAIGTKEKPILFLGKLPGVGTWKGIQFGSKDPKNELTYTTIEGGGSEAQLFTEAANIAMIKTSALKLTNSNIQKSGGYGLFVLASATNAEITIANNVFLDNTKAPVYLPAQLGSQVDNSSKFSQEKNAFVELNGYEPLTNPVRLKAIDVPYKVTYTIELKSSLTVDAGVTCLFAQSTSVLVGKSGSLTVNGTLEKHVVFRGAEEIQGHWLGLSFESSSPQNQLNYFDIFHGGSEAFLGMDPTNIGVYKGASLMLKQVTSSKSGGWGLYAEEGANLTTESVNYQDNKNGDDKLLP
ncbi:MAG: right-handed parallel beta-helix repeat-containing protein [Myxococcales bacterium]|nr:right-handed parallel beta-helix repeat-containing protein [Myxococcales bacterium]